MGDREAVVFVDSRIDFVGDIDGPRSSVKYSSLPY